VLAWQTWIAIALCLAAAAYVLRRAWLAVAERNVEGCGSGCGKCPSSETRKTLLSIEPAQGRPDAG
jgi:hypothetical protein